jgi:outer membrane protein insertion porin family
MRVTSGSIQTQSAVANPGLAWWVWLWAVGCWLLVPVWQYGQVNIKPGSYELAGVSVEGVELLDKNSILSLSGLSIGQKIEVPSEALASAIRKLWKQNIFADVRMEVDQVVDDKLFLKIALDERPRISKYTFEGVNKGQSDDLREKVSFVRGQRFTEARKRTAIRTIKNYFYDKGYLNTEVTVKAVKDPSTPNGVTIVLAVNKGKKVKIESIEIDGNLEVSNQKIKKVLKKTKEKKIYRLFSRSKYIPATYSEEKKGIVSLMNSKGFRDAKVVWDTVEKVDDRNVRLKIKVYEGSRYYFRSIKWVGNAKYSSGRLDTLLGVRPGDVYDTELLERRLTMDPGGTDVSSLYLDDGYLFFRADPVEVAIVNDSIDLEIRIVEGPQARYDRILIEGNDKTSDHVILREVRTLPGQKFSRSELIRSQREIMNLGFFSQENMNVVPIPNPEKGTVDIKYVVQEKPSDQLFFQGGWSGRIRDINGNVIGGGLVATVGVTFNNFSVRRMGQLSAWRPLPAGDGQKLSLRVQVNGPTFQNFGFNFMEPWFGGKKPNSFGFGVNYSRQTSLATNYLLNVISGTVDLGRRMKWPDDYFRTFTNFRYSYFNIREAGRVFINADGTSIPDGVYHLFSIKQTLDRTSIDAPIYPRRGSSLNASVEFTPPWSYLTGLNVAESTLQERLRLVEFHKWRFQMEQYVQLTNNKLPMVLYGRAMFGSIGYYNRQIGLPYFEQFRVGGDGLAVFGLFGTDFIPMRAFEQGIGGQNTSVFTKYTLELRQPITLSQSATVWVHGFVEAGNAFARFDQFGPFNLKRSAGGGVRIFLPIFGLLGFDYGFALDPYTTPSGTFPAGRGRFAFMIGQQF